MSKTLFLIVLIAAAVVVVAIVAGAVGGAVSSRKSSKNATSDTSIASCTGSQCPSTATSGSQTGTSVTGASPTGTSPSVPSTSSITPLDTTASIGALAASTTEDSVNGVYVHIYYQQGSNIAYRSYPGEGSFSAAQALPLTVQPKAGTSLAACEFYDATMNYMQLFYQDSSNNIICANFTSSLSTTKLKLINSVQIAAGTTADASSSLAAVYLEASSGWRAFYQATNGTILELVGTFKGWRAGAVLSTADAIAGSPLALSMLTAPKMNIFYVDSSTSSIYSISYNDGWQTPSALTSTAITKWNGSNTSLAAVQESEPLYMRTYYVGTDSEIHEFNSNPGGPFSKKSDQSPEWEVLDTQGPGALAGIGWLDQVRLYYVSQGKLVQSSLNNVTWASTTDF
ncbi:hypothetical protein NA56DRAFT_180764 [Hyaloscypha hepaticicola]|uniref:Uncharacterized protein n=1 Tax=Hyaloscypha hepaticicola TaxID=2082293 RepID=A0A2J6Q2B0_9HELO|nr:hypothetical protein NA56DRAFT_180764 [Hyaloscypha hepaticicola]